MTAENHIQIAGRSFKMATDTTPEHDVFTRTQLTQTGLGKLHLADFESPEAFTERGRQEFLSNPNLFLLLGGILIPAELDPLKWTPEIAAETAKFLGGVTAREDKQKLYGQMGAIVSGFLRAELALQAISQRFSVGKLVH